ncbi:MAG: EF-P 5-aminopentanol modification-associated protein YfmF, partial [Bacilli bacterium]
MTEWLYDDLDGVQLHVLPTEKYKMVSVLAQLERPLQRERVTATALLPQVLLRGTEQYDTQGKLLRAFDDLYGARVGARVNKHGDLQTVEFTMQVPHEAFIEGSGQLFGEAIRLFAQVIMAPKVEN